MKASRSKPIQDSYWRLQKELFWGRVDLSIGNFFRSEELPELHFYVAERCLRIADYFERRGWIKSAHAYRAEAKKHLDSSGLKHRPPDGPPPAAAMAMPIPEEPILTEAIGESLPEDSARRPSRH